MVCVRTAFVFVCGGYHFPWAYPCLDSWHIAGQYLLNYLTVPPTFHKWTKPIIESKGPTRKHLQLRVYFLWQGHTFPVRSKCNENIIRNLSLTLNDTVESIARTTAAQKRSLDSLAKIVSDDRIITLDYLLAEQGSVCAVANTICCTWINISGKTENKILWESWNSIT